MGSGAAREAGHWDLRRADHKGNKAIRSAETFGTAGRSVDAGFEAYGQLVWDDKNEEAPRKPTTYRPPSEMAGTDPETSVDPPMLALQGGQHGSITALAYSPDGQQLATTDGFRVRVVDAATGHVLRTLLCASGPIVEIAWSPDGTRLAATTAEHVQVWGAASGKLVATYIPDFPGRIRSAFWCRDDRLLAAVNDVDAADNSLYVIDLVTGARIGTVQGGGRHPRLAWSGGGSLAVACIDGAARLCDNESSGEVTSLNDAGGSVRWRCHLTAIGSQRSALTVRSRRGKSALAS